MKLCITILAVYIQALAVIPCDGYGIALSKFTEDILGIAINHQNNHKHFEEEPFKGCEEDGCTPFCTCHCCTVPAQEPAEFALILEIQSCTISAVPIYIPDAVPDNFLNSVWHPPLA